MTEREKVLKGLECCCSMTGDACRQCPYDEECAEMIGSGSAHLCSDALELLKEQEPVKPSLLVSNGPDDVCSQWYLCGKCKKPIDHKDRFCKRCGQAVRWE